MMSIESIYSLIWVTDPFDPDITYRYNMIIKALNGPRFTVITKMTTGLEQSIIKNEYKVKEVPGDEIDYSLFIVPRENPVAVIQEQIGLISFVPVVISTIFNFKDIVNTNLYQSNPRIVKLFTELLLHTLVDYVDQVKYLIPSDNLITSMFDSGIFDGLDDNNQQYLISYIPYLTSGEAIYRKASYLTDLILACDLNKLKGFQPLKYDPLIEYAISKVNIPTVEKKRVLVGNKEIIFIPNGDENTEIKYQIEDFLQTLRIQGYFSIPSLSWLSPLCLEIAKMMKIDIHQLTILQISPHYPLSDFKMPIEQWITNNALRILNNKLPTYIVDPPSIITENSNVYSSLDLKTKLLFASLRAYYRLTHDNPILLPHITNIRILPNFAIKIPIATLDDILKFKHYLPIMLEGMDQWLVLTCRDLLEGILIRWYIQHSTDLFAMVLRFDDVETIVINSPDSAKLVLSFDYDQMANDVLSYFRNYYQSPSLTLNQIVSQVPLRNQWYKPTDPQLTDLTEMEVAHILYYRWQLRGLFSIDGLIGMISEIPIKRLISPPEGILSISEHEGMTVVEVISGEGKIIPLFELRMDGRGMFEVLEKLWECGWFLSDWATCYAIRFNKLSYALYRTQMLISASESVEKSFKVMDMLQRYSLYRC